MYCHNLEVMSLIPGCVELGVRDTSKLYLNQNMCVVSQSHEMYCHNLNVMGLNFSRVELGVRGPSKLYLNRKM